jgi:hypothetical protein
VTPPGRRAAVLLPVLAVVAAGTLPAQDSLVTRPDTAQAAAADTTTVRDSLPPARTLPIQEPGVPPGPLPPGARYSFTRDSILWSDALTLADLLATIPGVYVARGGFVGQPAHVQYAGRGGAELEVYWDGLRWEPLGVDSLAVDPDRILLSYLRRVDVEVRPGALQVYLVSERHETNDVRSLIRVTSGAFKTAAYTAMFQKRWPRGLSLDVAGDFLGTDGPDARAGSSQFDLWAKLGWMPSPRLGAAYQVRRQESGRDALQTVTGGAGVPALEGTRTDYLLTLYAQTRDDGLGLRVEGGLGVSQWRSDSGFQVPDQTLRQAWGRLRYQRSRWTATVDGRLGDSRVPYEASARLGLVPLPGIVLSSEARWRRLAGARTTRGARATLGLYRGPFALAGELEWRRMARAAALADDTVLTVADRGVRAVIDTRPLSGSARLLWRDGFVPLAYTNLPAVPGFGPTVPATYLVTDVTLRPTGAISLTGSWSDPVAGSAPDLKPPSHLRAAITLRSKYWRTFRSGAFDLKLQAAVESWGEGVAGVTTGGGPIPLPEATFWEWHIEIQLVDFTAFWTLRNARLADGAYVPGLPYPKNVQTFGVTWVFSN